MIEEAWLTPFWKTKQSPWNYPGAIVCCLAYLAVDTVLEKEIREKGHRKATVRRAMGRIWFFPAALNAGTLIWKQKI